MCNNALTGAFFMIIGLVGFIGSGKDTAADYLVNFHGYRRENKIRTSRDNIVITDCRFPNEIKAIQAQGGKIVWIQRGPLPLWYPVAVRANLGEAVFIENLKTLGVHPSETAWAGTEFDAEINNNDSIEELFLQLKNLVLTDPASKVVGTYIPLAHSSSTQF